MDAFDIVNVNGWRVNLPLVAMGHANIVCRVVDRTAFVMPRFDNQCEPAPHVPDSIGGGLPTPTQLDSLDCRALRRRILRLKWKN